VTDWKAYERRKAAWKASHPSATPEEYEQAALREFCGEKSSKPVAATTRAKRATEESRERAK